MRVVINPTQRLEGSIPWLQVVTFTGTPTINIDDGGDIPVAAYYTLRAPPSKYWRSIKCTGTITLLIGEQADTLAPDFAPLAGGGAGGDVNVASYGGVATSLGQKAMAASAPVVIASDQSAVPVSNIAGLTNQTAALAALAATLSFQVRQGDGIIYAEINLPAGTVLTLVAEGSADNSNWDTLPIICIGNSSAVVSGVRRGERLTSLACTTTGTNIFSVPLHGAQFFRFRVSSYTSGTANIRASTGIEPTSLLSLAVCSLVPTFTNPEPVGLMGAGYDGVNSIPLPVGLLAGSTLPTGVMLIGGRTGTSLNMGLAINRHTSPTAGGSLKVDKHNDFNAQNDPAAATIATVTQAAPGVGKQLIVTGFEATFACGAAAGGPIKVTLTINAVAYSYYFSCPVNGCVQLAVNELSIRGADNGTAVLAFNAAGPAGSNQSVVLHGYTITTGS